MLEHQPLTGAAQILSGDGTLHDSFDCDCSHDNSCLQYNRHIHSTCNCDSSFEPQKDVVTISDKEKLPIVEFMYSMPTAFQHARHLSVKVGPLICKGIEIDHCQEPFHAILNDPTRNFEKTTFAGAITDNIASGKHSDWKGTGWYRIMSPAGTQLYSSKIDYGRSCGSFKNGYYLGKYPQDKGSVVKGEVCFGFDNGSIKDDTCVQRTDIKIKNCGEFYIFFLKDVGCHQNPCYARYCTE